ncbi:MAG: rhodanese-like domain-containing protein [Magnetococcales bacterium]|nr:rhodanese-like domain-containing protein [Magnetococcales bacterium]
MKRSLTVESFLRGVAQGDRRYRVIDLRGDYQHAIPGSIPTRFHADIFYEEAGWVQDMLGIEFKAGQTILLVCNTGNSSLEAVRLFQSKNRRTDYTLVSLDGGMLAYQERIRRWTAGYRRQDQFLDEMTLITTPATRFQFLVTSLWQQRKPKGWQRLFHPSSWF